MMPTDSKTSVLPLRGVIFLVSVQMRTTKATALQQVVPNVQARWNGSCCTANSRRPNQPARMSLQHRLLMARQQKSEVLVLFAEVFRSFHFRLDIKLFLSLKGAVADMVIMNSSCICHFLLKVQSAL